MAVAVGACLIALSGCSQPLDTQIHAHISSSNLINATLKIQSNQDCSTLTVPNHAVLSHRSVDEEVWSCIVKVKNLPATDAQSIMDIVESGLSGSTADLTITRTDSTFSVRGSLSIVNIEGDGCNWNFVPTVCHTFNPTVTLSLTFPGKVTKGNGTISGRTISWTLTNTSSHPEWPQSITMEAQSSAVVSLTQIFIIIGTGVVGLAILIVIVQLVRIHRKRISRSENGVPARTETRKAPPAETL